VNRHKLTKTYVDRLSPSQTDIIHWDTEIRGFGVKVTPKGKKVYLVQYRPHGSGGNPRKFTIGSHAEIPFDLAKRKAHEIVAAKASGGDPQREKRTARQKLASNCFSDVVEDHIAQRVSQFRAPRERKRLLRHEFVTAFGQRSVHGITRRDVSNVLEQIYARGAGRTGNMALVAIRVFFDWCVSKAILETSPCVGLRPAFIERSRDRVLSDDELTRILGACRELGYPFGSLVEMLACTAQRRSEVARMQWSHVSLDTSNWVIPAEHSKNGKPHIVHLSERVTDLLRVLPRKSNLVFSANGETPFNGFSKSKARIDDRSGVHDWTLHDLRRTVVSGMAKLGVSHHVADKILNHQSGAISGVAAVYQRHDFLTERKDAINLWSDHLDRLSPYK
jgi:integrase